MSLSETYPWYKLISEGDELDQGDILFDCPIVQIHESSGWPLPPDEVPIAVLTADVIVMTATCDFANDKAKNVIVCRHESLQRLEWGKGRQKEVVKGARPREVMLECSPFEEIVMDRRVIDLGEIYSLPISVLRLVATNQSPRLRLLPPYREHISQAFARFFMRVGLPQDITIE